MISCTPVRTDRLELIPAASEHLRCDLSDRSSLARLLDASVPDAWPPESLGEDVLREFIRMSEEGRDPYFSFWYWILHDTVRNLRILIGSGGTMSSQEPGGTVVIGYGVLDEYQGMGYATEAVGALIPFIFKIPGIIRIRATTSPDLPASVRVLEKNGFTVSESSGADSGREEGPISFERVCDESK